LVRDEPAANLPSLSTALNHLGVRLSWAGDKQAALEPFREAVAVLRRLAGGGVAVLGRLAAHEQVHLPALAAELNSLGTHLFRAGQLRAALEPSAEAVGIYRRVAGGGAA